MERIGFGVDRGLQPVGIAGYSTTNDLILQKIAETLTGKSIQELVKGRLTELLARLRHARPGAWPIRLRRQAAR